MGDCIEDLPGEWLNESSDWVAREQPVTSLVCRQHAAQLNLALKWIPASTRLPTEPGDYLVVETADGSPFRIDVQRFSAKLGFSDYVTHWRPLPKGPTP
ncbi:MAG TPA: hypothetical protein VGK73_11670 [Polyangiaceae bacterium]